MGLAALSSIAADQRDTLIREKFIAGLLPQLRELIIYSSPKTFNEAMTLAERLEGLQAGKQDTSAKSVMLLESISDRLCKLECGTRTNNWNGGSNETFLLEQTAPKTNIMTRRSPNYNLSNQRPDIRSGDVVCYQCNRNGHIARNCPRNRDMSTVICRACNRMGHFARNCQSRRVTLRPRPGPQPFNRRPHIPIGRYGFPPGNQPPNRTMAVTVPSGTDPTRPGCMDPPTEASEELRWQPLIGSIRFSRENETRFAKGETRTNPSADESPEMLQSSGKGYLDGRKALTWMKVHLLVMIFLILGTNVAAQRHSNRKSSSPMVCQAYEGKALWKLPATFNCPTGNHTTEKDVTPVKMLLYKRNYVQYKTKAWKCVRITQEVETFTYFFGDENLKKDHKHSETVSAEDCMTMKNYKICRNQPMIFYGGIYQTKNEMEWHYPGGGINCCHWKKFTVTNCYMYQSHVYKRHDTSAMESPAGDVSNCKYQKGQCILPGGAFLLWDVSKKSMCEQLPWKTVSGKKYGTSWLSDDSNLALTFTQNKQTNDCDGHAIQMSDQGIAVRPKVDASKSRKIRQLSVEQLNGLQTLLESNGGVVSTSQLAASLEALELRWQQNMEFAFSHALNGVCNFMRSVVELLKTQVLANPTMAIRSLTNQTEIFAKSGGNIVEIFPCTQLRRTAFSFKPMNETCTAQIPIKFKINNKTNHGYLDVLTNIIHRFSVPIDCHLVNEVPLQIEDKTYLYHSKTGHLTPAHHIPTLKIMQWSVEPIFDMKATIFHEIVIYNWDELQTHISLNDIMGGLDRQRTVLQHMGISAEEGEPSENAERAVSHIMGTGYFGFLHGLTANLFQVWTFMVCLYVTICVCILHCLPINGIPVGLNMGHALNLLRNRWVQFRQTISRDQEMINPEQMHPLQQINPGYTGDAAFNQQLRAIRGRVGRQPLLQLMPPPSATEVAASAPVWREPLPPRKRPRYDDPPEIITSHDDNVQPFTVNAISGPSETVVDVYIYDDRYMKNGWYAKALLDSGSTYSIMTLKFAKKLKELMTDTSSTAKSASGHDLVVVGEIFAVVRLNSKNMTGNILVTETLPYDLIVGTESMKQLGYMNFNFEKRVILLKNDTIFMESTEQEREEASKEEKRRMAARPRPPWGIADKHDPALSPYVIIDGRDTFLVCPRLTSTAECGRFPLRSANTYTEIDGIQRKFKTLDFHHLVFIADLHLRSEGTLKKQRGIPMIYRQETDVERERTDVQPETVITNDEAGNHRSATMQESSQSEGSDDQRVPGGEPVEDNRHESGDTVHAVNALSGTSEVVIYVCIEGMKVRSLIDTGSSLTLVPQHIARLLRTPVSHENITAVSMTGHQLGVVGETTATVRIGNKDVVGKVVVVEESPYELIIGTDLMKHFGTLKLDFGKKMISFGTEKLSMVLTHPAAGVFLCQQARIPPKSKMVVMGMCYGLTPEEVTTAPVACFSPSSKLLTKYDVVSQEAIVQPTDKIVPVVLSNPDKAPKFLPEKATLGHVQKLDPHETNSIRQQTANSDMIVRLGPSRTEEEMNNFRSEIRIEKHLTGKQKWQLRRLIEKYEGLFARNDYDLGQTDLVEHEINTGDARPISQRPYRTPHSLRPYLSKKINEMLDQGIIQPSNSDWSSPVVLVKKKDTSDLRFCVDNRKLNDVTIKDSYPLKRIDDAFDMLCGARYFVTLDLQSGYWQIPLKKSDQKKTAFVTGDGLYEFTKMNFGLCNAPATFQRLMDHVLRGLDLKICMSYIDDIIVPGQDMEQLVERLEEVFRRLKAAGLKLKLRKCQFGMQELKFLGFVISRDGLKPDPEKIAKILDATAPESRDELRTFLGFAGWCKRFIESYAHVAEPLTDLLKQSKTYKWILEADTAFNNLKILYTKAPILRYPDMGKMFIIVTDASNRAIGAVLCQLDENQIEHPVSYDSRVLTQCERNYSTIEKEMLAIFWAVVKKYRVYVYGRDFLVFTDHKPLLGVWKAPPNEGRLGRWILKMQEYRPHMTLQYREGKTNVVADYLSRNPVDTSTQPAAVMLTEVIEDRDIRYQQRSDDYFSAVIKYLENGERPENQAVAEKIAKWAPSYGMIDGILHKKSTKYSKMLVVVPKDMRKQILIANHDSLLGGHLGIRKTLSRIEKSYFWPGYYKDVVEWCRSCLSCQTRKPPHNATKAPLTSIPVRAINQRWGWDICGPLPLSQNGNRYVLVCMEYFTKFPELYAVPDTKAGRLAKIFVENIVLRYGCPDVLISDQGLNVHSELIKEICKLLDVQKLRTSPYHPQSDGMVERFNRTLQSMISMYINKGHTDWCEFLPYLAFAYRASVHDSTKESPFFLMYGFDPRLPIDLAITPTNGAYVSSDEDYKLYVLSSLLESRRLITQNIEQAQERQATNYDRKTQEHTFMEGDRILVHFPNIAKGKSKKFSRNWRGPYRILEVSPNGANILIEAIGSKRAANKSWIHVNRAKAVNPTTGPWELGEVERQAASSGEAAPRSHGRTEAPTEAPQENTEGESTNEPQPGDHETGAIPSSIQEPNNQPPTGNRTNNKDKCTRCGKRGQPGKWIACDQCGHWYHFDCVGVQSITSEEEQWICPACRNNTEPRTRWNTDEVSGGEDSDSSVETIEEHEPDSVDAAEAEANRVDVNDNGEVYYCCMVSARTAEETNRTPRQIKSGRSEHYTVDARIGTGGFGKVYSGNNVITGEPVAIKVIPNKNITEWGTVNGEKVPLELQILHHCQDVPGVVKLLDWGNFTDSFYIVMDRPSLDGDLYSYVESRKHLPEEVARLFFIQILETVTGCLKKGVFHRDLKDENILVNLTQRQITLIDFGAAAWKKNEPYRENSGTRLYSPPEWIEGKPYYGEPATVWSLGLMLYAMFCGDLPYLCEDEIVTNHLVFTQPVPDPCIYLIKECLKSNPAQRITLSAIGEKAWIKGLSTAYTNRPILPLITISSTERTKQWIRKTLFSDTMEEGEDDSEGDGHGGQSEPHLPEDQIKPLIQESERNIAMKEKKTVPQRTIPHRTITVPKPDADLTSQKVIASASRAKESGISTSDDKQIPESTARLSPKASKITILLNQLPKTALDNRTKLPIQETEPNVITEAEAQCNDLPRIDELYPADSNSDREPNNESMETEFVNIQSLEVQFPRSTVKDLNIASHTEWPTITFSEKFETGRGAKVSCRDARQDPGAEGTNTQQETAGSQRRDA